MSSCVVWHNEFFSWKLLGTEGPCSFSVPVQHLKPVSQAVTRTMTKSHQKSKYSKSFLSSNSSCALWLVSKAKYRLSALLFFWEDPVMSGFINPPTEPVRKLWNKVSCWKPCLESAYPHLHFDFCDLTEGTGCPCQISLAYRGIYKVELPKAAWLMRTATATQPMHP